MFRNVFKPKKTGCETPTIKQRRLVVGVKTFFATHTLGLETQINTWLIHAKGKCIKDIRYAQAQGEFSALIIYSEWRDEEE